MRPDPPFALGALGLQNTGAFYAMNDHRGWWYVYDGKVNIIEKGVITNDLSFECSGGQQDSFGDILALAQGIKKGTLVIIPRKSTDDQIK